MARGDEAIRGRGNVEDARTESRGGAPGEAEARGGGARSGGGRVSQSGSGSRAVSHPSGTPPGVPTPVCAATIPPTIAAVVSTSPPASTQARIAAG